MSFIVNAVKMDCRLVVPTEEEARWQIVTGDGWLMNNRFTKDTTGSQPSRLTGSHRTTTQGR
jgi:hypothetical protein